MKVFGNTADPYSQIILAVACFYGNQILKPDHQYRPEITAIQRKFSAFNLNYILHTIDRNDTIVANNKILRTQNNRAHETIGIFPYSVNALLITIQTKGKSLQREGTSQRRAEAVKVPLK